MFYELTIAFLSVAISFVIYFSFIKHFHIERHTQESDDEIVNDPRYDLNGKELLFVSVVRDINLLYSKYSISNICTSTVLLNEFRKNIMNANKFHTKHFTIIIQKPYRKMRRLSVILMIAKTLY